MAMIPSGFSPGGEYFAFSSPDGTIKIYDGATGSLKQEYTPSSHLSATCSCLSWCPVSQSNVSPQKRTKKRKSDFGTAVKSHDLIAIGTNSGSLLLYSVIKGYLQTQLSGGHTDAVTCTCWSVNGDRLFSCSTDQHIVQWCLSSASVKHKWKADKGAVNCISVCQTDSHLLSAGRTIKLWDLDTFTLLKTFTGHASEVLCLLPVLSPTSTESHNGATELSEIYSSIEGTYFLSAAAGDRLVSAWQINTSSKEKCSIASFSLAEEPAKMYISPPQKHGQPFLMLVVTRNGQLHVFEYVLNGRCKKPVAPKLTIQVASDASLPSAASKTLTPRPIPVLGATITPSCTPGNRDIMLVHGTLLKPTFEKLAGESLDKDVCLIRDDPNKSVVHNQQSVSKVKTAEVPSEVTVLAPGHMQPQGPARADGEGEVPRSRKRRKSSTEMTMEERLSAISIDKIGHGGEAQDGKTPPKADALAILLAQGLQSNDKKILNHVLQNTNMTLIRNTVRRLPVPVIVPLVQELSRRMQGHAQSGRTHIKWVKTVLTLHTSYLMTFPELVESLGSLYSMMESRVATYSRLSKLQGKLQLMMAQVSSQEQAAEQDGAAQQPLLLYQDESSDDEIGLEEMFPDQGESDDNWEADMLDEARNLVEEPGGQDDDEEEDMEADDDENEEDEDGDDEEEEDEEDKAADSEESLSEEG